MLVSYHKFDKITFKILLKTLHILTSIDILQNKAVFKFDIFIFRLIPSECIISYIIYGFLEKTK